MKPFNLTDDQEAILTPFSERLQQYSLKLVETLTTAGLTEHQAGVVLRDEALQLALQYEHAIAMDTDTILSREKWIELAGIAFDQYEDIAVMAHAINAVSGIGKVRDDD